MNWKSAALTLTLVLASSAPTLAVTILPDACGDDKTGFDIKIKKDQPPPAAPEAGKALIVFVETAPSHALAAGGHTTVMTNGATGQSMVMGGGGAVSSFSFLALPDAEGRYRVKAWPLSLSTATH